MFSKLCLGHRAGLELATAALSRGSLTIEPEVLKTIALIP